MTSFVLEVDNHLLVMLHDQSCLKVMFFVFWISSIVIRDFWYHLVEEEWANDLTTITHRFSLQRCSTVSLSYIYGYLN